MSKLVKETLEEEYLKPIEKEKFDYLDKLMSDLYWKISAEENELQHLKFQEKDERIEKQIEKQKEKLKQLYSERENLTDEQMNLLKRAEDRYEEENKDPEDILDDTDFITGNLYD